MNKNLDSRGVGYYDVFPEDVVQINISVVFPGVVKAWHRHIFQNDYFFVPFGNAQVGLADSDENGDPKEARKVFIGEHNLEVLFIPMGTWHGFTPIGNKPCVLVYGVTQKYNPKNPDEERMKWDEFGRNFWEPENE